ncbi:hypothetical protein QEZ52_09285 [Aliisedimentitalea scapharcae]|uniref:Uncharacterized protein n=1 Tax=Aliisedimentitalea scapharcae TaxID=1524259 RepID=A0ABZ2XX92_9RHOB
MKRMTHVLWISAIMIGGLAAPSLADNSSQSAQVAQQAGSNALSTLTGSRKSGSGHQCSGR